MTPAINALKKQKIAHRVVTYDHDPSVAAYGTEAAEALGLNPQQVFKTLLVALNGDQKKLAVAVVPVAGQLNLKAMAAAVGVKKVEMADPKAAERSSGYIVGGISPVGQKRALPTVVDASANTFEQIYASGGRRGMEICLAPADLVKVTRASFAAIAK